MTRIFYDAVTASNIPRDAQGVCGYVDGRYAWSLADWNLFPQAVKVDIAVRSTTNAGTVLDVERGNATPAQSVDWVLMRRAAGADPTIYCNELDPVTGWPAVRAAFRARNVPEPHYWIAKYDGNTTIPSGAVAKQYENTAGWDLSAVADYWPGVDPAPAPPVSLTTPKEIDMLLLSTPDGIWLLSGSLYVKVDDENTLNSLKLAGVQHADFDAAMHAAVLAAANK